MEWNSPILYWPLMLVVAYLVGAIPFAQLVAKSRGVDLRQVGSGNVGAGNVTSQIGKGWGVLVALLDFAKGFLPVYLARRAGLGFGASGFLGIAAIVGHNWSIWMKGRSGRGLATSAGMLAALNPALLVWVGGWAIAGWKIGGGVAGFLGWGLLPFVTIVFRQPISLSLVLMLLSAILIGRRIQGNPSDSWERDAVVHRAIFDTDHHGEEFPEGVEDPLTP